MKEWLYFNGKSITKGMELGGTIYCFVLAIFGFILSETKMEALSCALALVCGIILLNMYIHDRKTP